MQKIPTIYKRDPNDMRLLLPEPQPDCDWVFAGEGLAKRKYDGTCCLVRGGELYKRREVKEGSPIPDGFVSVGKDCNTGKMVGWVPVDPDASEDQYHREAWAERSFTHGTYELLGPKIQGNPENMDVHCLILHDAALEYSEAPTGLQALKEWLAPLDIEGLVWHHPDGRMAKIKKRDLGLKRKPS